MTRILLFGVVILASSVGVLLAEHRAVRNDLTAMESAYQSFLAQSIGGKPMADRIRPGSLAVFRQSDLTVGCAVMR